MALGLVRGQDLGVATLRLSTNLRGLDQGLDKAENKTRHRMAKIGKIAAAAVATAVVGLGVVAVHSAVQVEKGFAEVRTLLPKIGDQAFGALEKDVLDFSSRLGVATNESIPSLYQAISAGVPPNNVIEFLDTGAKAAIGGVTDLKTAVDGISSVINAYGSDVLSAGHASDLMFTAVRLGKCLTGETRVLLADGRYERIDTLCDGGEIVSFDGRGFVPMRAKWVAQGTKPTVTLETRMGRRITTTWTHPYLTPDGWREVREVSVGDQIAVPTHLPYFGSESVTEAEAALLGLWLAEGSSDLSSVCITSTAYGDQIHGWAAHYGCRVKNAERRPGKAPQWRITAGPRGGSGPTRINPVQEMLRGHDLGHCTSATKRIPAAVFTWDRASVATLLYWLFNGDGWLADMRPKRSGFQVGFCSKSEQLVRDVAHLMLRFGIVGRVRYRPESNAWVWETNRYREVRRFVDSIGIDRPAASAVLKHEPKKQRSMWGVVEYDPIVRIEAGPDEPVYDLVVPVLHNFVAEDIVAHNTTFEELSASLFNVVPIAAASGVSFEEITAALAALTAQGVPTSVATTQLRSAIQSLTAPTIRQAKIVRELGLDFSATRLQQIGLAGAFEEAIEATDGNMAILRKLIGSVEGLQAVLALGGEQSHKFTNALKEMETATGATDKAFGIMANTNAFQLQKAINDIKLALVEIGEELLPTVTDIIENQLLPLGDKVRSVMEWLFPSTKIAREAREDMESYIRSTRDLRDAFSDLRKARAKTTAHRISSSRSYVTGSPPSARPPPAPTRWWRRCSHRASLWKRSRRRRASPCWRSATWGRRPSTSSSGRKRRRRRWPA